ncbi:conserved hypothetical protein [Paecilomyces variotii No. 5]|uniref:Uncharacterized protein n=1 Tax=Byssochlamys spectabilis (strain No. 5 / NBRC 109023) TaxID=1356009 RepID=V5FCF0_BYSSN|nr:conserved hypothetical protein [Paecilomyces variotii No. 5]
MSMDAGGLAQMTYNSSFNGGSLGVPGSSFASRGKGAHIKRLSVAPIDETQAAPSVSTPRTSRSHLLAGLRTAPKSATLPPTQHQQHRMGLDGSRHAVSNQYADRVPQTASAAGFPQHAYGAHHNLNAGMGMNSNRPMYSLPEQVLAPPSIDLGFGDGEEPIDDKLYAELMSTNLFLAAQQQRLQQQLISVTAAAQQFQNLNLGLQQQQQQQFSSVQVPAMGFYQQQLQQGMQPIVQPVAGQPGLYSVYNPMTGQQSFIFDNSAQQESSPPPAYQEHAQSPVAQAPTFRAEVSPPAESKPSPAQSRNTSPPRHSPSPPQDVTPLPPPSANAFRRGHKKTPSLNPGLKVDAGRTGNGAPKSAVFPPTPMTGTFGPGQARAGEHPIRQPRGPPSMEELIAKPTSKHEGSKNFAARQRRRAVHNLVRAGIERRGESRSNGSGGTNTPASETEFTFSVSDGDDCTSRSGSLSSKPSLGSLRAAASGAIGSERKEKDRSSRERGSVDSLFTMATVSSDDGNYIGGKLAEVRQDRVSSPQGPPSAAAVVAGQRTVSQGPERRRMPMLVLSSAEKRKTPLV